ncbi:MAG TPA: endo alpha-1,4 polygalactosaminidase [Pseudonocardiaceae bacterium]|nr:endo alpha-1,4 polygalactosaminidase [Pseudonocardiaceae bacterium]
MIRRSGARFGARFGAVAGAGALLLLGVSATAGCGITADQTIAGDPSPAATESVLAPTPAGPADALTGPPATTQPVSKPPPPPTPPPPAVRAPGRWVPAQGEQWQWQLTNPIDTSVNVPIYDVDSTYTTAATVATLHAQGRKVICYVNAGASEDFRPDKDAFPPSVLGDSDNWPGELWLDIRQLDILRPIMAARFDLCRAKGFDGIEADLVDGYTNSTGFPLTAQDQLNYNQMLASLAHQRGLSIGLKNDLDQVPQLVNDFDFAIVEQCFQYQECDQLQPFIRAGKAVFEVEYQLANSQFCPTANALRFSAMRKNLALDPPRWPC